MRIEVMAAIAVAFVAAGCTERAIDWEEPTSATADSVAQLRLSADGSPMFSRPEPTPAAPPDSARCESGAAFARDGGDWYATWNRKRKDGSVLVVAARSRDQGASWSNASVVDSVDVARVGCTRPGPAIAATDGYVHIAYSIQAPEGFGVFFAHSMDATATFHSAVPVVYGDRLSAVAVAADGMNVVVAYENPGGTGHQVDAALSRTQGHTFEPRVRSSPDEMASARPQVAIHGNVLAVSFIDPGSANRIVRIGHIH
jgi:hypothetical protein